MFLVTGATGNVGAEVVRQLIAAGQPVKALVRDERRAADLPAGAAAVIGDLNDPDSFAGALDDVVAIHLLAGYDGLDRLLDGARAAGVRRVVLQSSSAAPTGNLDNAVARYHILTERAIEASGLDWTFLRPNAFMSNSLEWTAQIAAGDVVRGSFPDVAVSTIDPADIAAVSVRALTTGAHAGRAYRLSGPEALLPADRVAILSRLLGRELRFEGLTDDEARAEMSAKMPAQYVDAFFEFYAEGGVDETTVHPDVEEVLGRPPHTFEQWARDHAEEFSRGFT